MHQICPTLMLHGLNNLPSDWRFAVFMCCSLCLPLWLSTLGCTVGAGNSGQLGFCQQFEPVMKASNSKLVQTKGKGARILCTSVSLCKWFPNSCIMSTSQELQLDCRYKFRIWFMVFWHHTPAETHFLFCVKFLEATTATVNLTNCTDKKISLLWAHFFCRRLACPSQNATF